METNNTPAAEQNRKYAPGTRILVQGHATKAENGLFQVLEPFIDQPNGDNYFQWRRVAKNGAVITNNNTPNLRGGRFSWLEKHAQIVAQ